MGTQEGMQILVSKSRKGDREAFDQLVDMHSERLLAFIRTRLGDHLRRQVEPEDVFQETCLRAFRSVDSFEWRGEGSFFGWTASIAEYAIRELGRSYRGTPFPLDRDPSDSVPSPSRMLRREERFDHLKAALADLPEDHQTVIRLARIEGLSVNDVALKMDRSPGAIRHLLLRALQSLRQRFGDDTQSLGLPQRPLGEKEGRCDVGE